MSLFISQMRSAPYVAFARAKLSGRKCLSISVSAGQSLFGIVRCQFTYCWEYCCCFSSVKPNILRVDAVQWQQTWFQIIYRYLFLTTAFSPPNRPSSHRLGSSADGAMSVGLLLLLLRQQLLLPCCTRGLAFKIWRNGAWMRHWV